MKLIFSTFIWLLLPACNLKQERPATRLLHTTVTVAAVQMNYDSCKQYIFIMKRLHRAEWNSTAKKGKEMVFTRAVTETIIPNWIGTKWDFNGTTEIPQQGSIACGYFVTTVLRDAGLPVARVKLAQMASEQMITSLVQSKYIQRFSNVTIEDFTAAVAKQGFGLYLIGLDNHTGFIYNDGDAVFFIHSSVVGTRNVQKEIAVNSRVLQQSKYKVLGKISADEKVLAKWIN
jgi:hypothetical protein